jgi:hypothetical protein
VEALTGAQLSPALLARLYAGRKVGAPDDRARARAPSQCTPTATAGAAQRRCSCTP